MFVFVSSHSLFNGICINEVWGSDSHEYQDYGHLGWCHVVWKEGTSVLDELPASIFRVEKLEDGGSWTLQTIGVHLPDYAT